MVWLSEVGRRRWRSEEEENERARKSASAAEAAVSKRRSLSTEQLCERAEDTGRGDEEVALVPSLVRHSSEVRVRMQRAHLLHPPDQDPAIESSRRPKA